MHLEQLGHLGIRKEFDISANEGRGGEGKGREGKISCEILWNSKKSQGGGSRRVGGWRRGQDQGEGGYE